MVSSYRTQAAGCIGGACFAFARLITRNYKSTTPAVEDLWSWRSSVLGVAVLAGPAMAAFIAGRPISGSNGSLAIALTPIIVAICMGALGASGLDLPARLWPGLTGLTALLLLLPQPEMNPRLLLALCTIPLSAGMASAFLDRSLVQDDEMRTDPRSQRSWVGIALLGAAGVYSIFALQGRHEVSVPFSWLSATVDGLAAFLSLQALATLGVMRWCAQFFLIPLLTMIEGVVFLKPLLDVRSWLAFVLLGVSSAYLLWSPVIETDRALF